MRKKSNASRRVAVESTTNIRANTKIQGANREREEAAERFKDEAVIWEKAD